MGVGVDHGGVELLVTQELMDGSDWASGVEQLGYRGVPQAVRVDLDPGALPNIENASMQQIFAERLVGVSGAVTASFVYDGDGNRQCKH